MKSPVMCELNRRVIKKLMQPPNGERRNGWGTLKNRAAILTGISQPTAGESSPFLFVPDIDPDLDDDEGFHDQSCLSYRCVVVARMIELSHSGYFSVISGLALARAPPLFW